MIFNSLEDNHGSLVARSPRIFKVRLLSSAVQNLRKIIFWSEIIFPLFWLLLFFLYTACSGTICAFGHLGVVAAFFSGHSSKRNEVNYLEINGVSKGGRAEHIS